MNEIAAADANLLDEKDSDGSDKVDVKEDVSSMMVS